MKKISSRAGLLWAVIALAAAYLLLNPDQITFSPAQAFPASSAGPINILTVTQTNVSIVSKLWCSDCYPSQPNLKKTPQEQDPLTAAIQAAEKLTDGEYTGNVPTIDRVAGNSLGLPLGIAAWAEITGSTWVTPIAATGGLSSDAQVHTVDGTLAKSVLAQEQGDEVLIVPKGNWVSDDFTGEVVRVESLSEAVAAVCKTPGAKCPTFP